MNSLTFWIGLVCSLGLHIGITVVAIYPWTSSGAPIPIDLGLVTIEVPSDSGDGISENKEKAVPVIKRSMVKQKPQKEVSTQPTLTEAVAPITDSPRGEISGEPVRAALYGLHPEYPKYSRQHGQMGTVIYKASFDAEGILTNAEVEKSSGYSLLDDAALEALQEAKIPQARGTRRLAFRFVLSE